jgi:hypothetical protein
MSLKEELFQYLWFDFKLSDFENWIYKQDSVRFEELTGQNVYLDIISEDYSEMSINEIKRYIFNRLSNDLKADWEKYVNNKYIPLIGICRTDKALDYYKPEIRDWELTVDGKYEILEIINSSNKNDNHEQYVRYVDHDNDLYPSGFVPKELFEIDFSNVSDLYLVHDTGKGIEVRPNDWSEGFYRPTQYSFWEDFYDNEAKALKTYYNTLDRLGIKNAW